MTPEEIQHEEARRIAINEGIRLTRYYDDLGIPTIGVGYNLQRGDANLVAVGCSNIQGIFDGTASITEAQALALLELDLTNSIASARGSLASGIFDALTPARQCVIVDLVYNMGYGGWLGFTGTRYLIDQAQTAKNNNSPIAHKYFLAAGNHLEASEYYSEVGNRAKRNVAMLISGLWVSATGDGSDTPTLLPTT